MMSFARSLDSTSYDQSVHVACDLFYDFGVRIGQLTWDCDQIRGMTSNDVSRTPRSNYDGEIRARPQRAKAVERQATSVHVTAACDYDPSVLALTCIKWARSEQT